MGGEKEGPSQDEARKATPATAQQEPCSPYVHVTRSSPDEGDNVSSPGFRVTVRIVSAFAGCWVALWYIATASRTVTGGDNGELISAAHGLGVAHPPGYPLFTLLASISIRSLAWTGMEVAHRVSVLSAVCGGICCWALCRALVLCFIADTCDRDCSSDGGNAGARKPVCSDVASARWRDLACATACSIAFASNRRVWHISTHGEVFALNNAICALLLYEASWFFHADGHQAPENPRSLPAQSSSVSERSSPEEQGSSSSSAGAASSPRLRHSHRHSHAVWSARRGAFLCGIALSNQHTSLLLILPVALAVLLFPGPGRQLWRAAPSLLLCGLAGLAPYLYIPWAATRPTVATASWGGRECGTWGGLLRHVLRSDYGTFRLAPSDSVNSREGHLLRLWLFVSDLAWDSGQVGPVGAVWGVWACGQGRVLRRVGGIAVASLGLYLGGFLSLANVDPAEPTSRYVLSRFWPQAFLCCYLLAAAALRHAVRESGLAARLQVAVTVCVLAVTMLAHVRFGAALLAAGERAAERGYVEGVMRSLPRGALLLLQGDTPMFVAKYLQEIVGLRPDLTLLEPDLLPGRWYSADLCAAHKPRVAFPAGWQWGVGAGGGLAGVLLATQAVHPEMRQFAAPELKKHPDALAAFRLLPHGPAKELLPRHPPRGPAAPALYGRLQDRYGALRWRAVWEESAAAWRRSGLLLQTPRAAAAAQTAKEQGRLEEGQDAGDGSLGKRGKAAQVERQGRRPTWAAAPGWGLRGGGWPELGGGDGWGAAAEGNVWHALLSEGFFLLKSAGSAASREEEAGALMVAVERFEGLRREFRGRMLNSDLVRNLGLAYARLSELTAEIAGEQGNMTSLAVEALDADALRHASVASLSVFAHAFDHRPEDPVYATVLKFLRGDLARIRLQFPP